MYDKVVLDMYRTTHPILQLVVVQHLPNLGGMLHIVGPERIGMHRREPAPGPGRPAAQDGALLGRLLHEEVEAGLLPPQQGVQRVATRAHQHVGPATTNWRISAGDGTVEGSDTSSLRTSHPREANSDECRR